MIVDGKRLTIAQELKLHADLEHEETQALERMVEPATEPATKHVVVERLEQTIDIELLALQRMLDLSRFKRLMNIQPREYGQLAAVEQRNLLRAATGFRKRFDEIESWMTLNCAEEIETPECWRERA
jgi:hypothetical protein